MLSPRYLALAASLAFAAVAMVMGPQTQAAGAGETPVERDYSLVRALPAPQNQSVAEMMAKSDGCYSCHVQTDAPTMHTSDAVVLGCIDCHGGNPQVRGNPELDFEHPEYVAARDAAHVLPTLPESWHFPSSANPERSYSLLNREAPEFLRFVNPSDYRVAREACGACHMPVIEAAERSLMATGAMLWGGASYNNGILPFKNYVIGEAYTRDGQPAQLQSPGSPHGTVTPEQAARGALGTLYPLPTWHVVPPGLRLQRPARRPSRGRASTGWCATTSSCAGVWWRPLPTRWRSTRALTAAASPVAESCRAAWASSSSTCRPTRLSNPRRAAENRHTPPPTAMRMAAIPGLIPVTFRKSPPISMHGLLI
jgi:hypothetical protein